jgi:hypothetical protein
MFWNRQQGRKFRVGVGGYGERPLAALMISWQHMLSLLQCDEKPLAHSSNPKGRVSSCKSYSKRQSLAQRAGNPNGSTSYSEGK